MDGPDEEFTEYAPVSQSGNLWTPRSLKEAQDALLGWPVGGTYSDGADYDGVKYIVKRHVRVYRSNWERVDD